MKRLVVAIAATAILLPAGAAEAHKLPVKDARAFSKKLVKKLAKDPKGSRGQVRRCDRQSDHRVICDIRIVNIHEEGDDEIFGPNYRQKCWTSIDVQYVSSKRRQIGYRSTGWECESYRVR